MSAAWGAVGGALGLLALKAAVSSRGSAELSGGFNIADAAIRVIVDPTVPLIPDRRKQIPKKDKGKADNPTPNPKKKAAAKSPPSEPWWEHLAPWSWELFQ
ncbi:MAG: hypothetical protein ACLQBX_15915 [Candidatus Limnocylindrales bacterium]